MRIGIFTPYLDGLTGGEKYMLSLAACLSSDHEVVVFWDDKSIISRAQDKFGLDLSRIKIEKNIFSPSTHWVSRFMKSRMYDACIVLSDGSLPYLGSRNTYIHFQFPIEWVKGKTFKNTIKLRKVTRIFCNSFFTKKFIDKTFAINSTVLYPPIEIFKTKKEKKNIILNVGRFGRTLEGANFKKQDVMIKAFQELVEKGVKNWKLVLVVSVRPEDVYRVEELKVLAREYPVEFVINPDQDKLSKIYGSAKIYWHASGYGEDLKLHPEYAEHFGMTTVEAMGAGVVPVVINAGGQTEIVNDKKNGFLWSTTDQLITMTESLIKDTDMLKKIAREAEMRAKDFSYEKFCSGVLNLLNEKG